ncbi:hypothetical protein [Caulobacter hibisci]|uniref:PH domain-containing protein n=1 Tax=Caulobacter hibisci TaxID=2035993 RepID=A0ABS0T486_9CAUL|nr:hypothetical protein [Caulobacter hibisci]MBI1685905.1 hypothetical protein [Caulobacter hibisci]
MNAAPLLVRPHWRRMAFRSGAVLLGFIGWDLYELFVTHEPDGWMTPTLGAVTLALSLALVLRDKRPRLVVGPEGIHWRAHGQDPLVFLPWDEIVAVEIHASREDGQVLRLTLQPLPVLQRVASDQMNGRRLDIPLDPLELQPHVLIAAIQRRAPHVQDRTS